MAWSLYAALRAAFSRQQRKPTMSQKLATVAVNICYQYAVINVPSFHFKSVRVWRNTVVVLLQWYCNQQGCNFSANISKLNVSSVTTSRVRTACRRHRLASRLQPLIVFIGLFLGLFQPHQPLVHLQHPTTLGPSHREMPAPTRRPDAPKTT